ncbi:hypothetical protein [Nonomuraea africana]|uniref:SnoaL-like domain-containing protein n=1 Tax=Nonomuraea africana TaxID=46171 RepID=A0ABR9KUD1_9ACTN|nr:hypothetical protein [Nonomuraea africana]MBE1565642.1 hypothetical protein [Nonomuraea africana]
MMRTEKRQIPGLIAPVVAVALLGAGCADAGADRPFTPRKAAAAPTTATSPAVTETIVVGPKTKVLVERPVITDPRHAELLKAFTDIYAGMWRAVVTGDESYLERVADPGGRAAIGWVRGFEDRSVRGTARVFAMNVTAVMDGGAEVSACVDETRLRLLSGRGGVAVPDQPGWTRAAYLQAMILSRGDDGIWRVKDFRHGKEGCAR